MRSVATEDEEQAALFEWAALNEGRYPELKFMFAIPNGGMRPINTAKTMKNTGTKKGVPDIFLSVPKKEFHGLYIEMKRRKNGRVSPEQREWITGLREQGYQAEVCKGWTEATAIIRSYLRGV